VNKFNPDDPFFIGDVCKKPHALKSENFIMHYIFFIVGIGAAALVGAMIYFTR